MTAGLLVVEEVRHRGRFAELRREWQDLLARGRCDLPCLDFDWLDAWWEAFARDNVVLLLLRDEQARLVAAAPLQWRRSWCSGVPLRSVMFASNVHSFRFDFVLAADAEPGAVLAPLLRHALASTPAPDVFVLQNIRCDSGRLEVMRKLAPSCGLTLGTAQHRCSPFIPIQGAWESYLQQRSKSFRSFLRRSERQWCEAGGKFETVSSGPGARQLLEQGLALEASGWKGRNGTAILQSGEEARFYRGLAERLEGTGRLRQYSLRLGGRLVGWDLCLIHQGVCYALKTCYDEAQAAMSPGFVLQLFELKQLFAEGELQRYELLPPTCRFKSRWTDEFIRQFGVRLYTRRPRARLACAVQNLLVPLVRRARLQRLVSPLRNSIDAVREALGLGDV